MKSIIILVIVALLSATRADDATTVAADGDISTEKAIVTEAEPVEVSSTEEPAVTTVVVTTTIPTTISTSTTTVSPTTTERITTAAPTTTVAPTTARATTTERITTTTTTTTPAPKTTSRIRQTTTSLPPTLRSRSRLGKARQNDEPTPKSDLLSIKVLKPDTIDSARTRSARPSATVEPRLIPINVIHSEPIPTARRFQSVAATTSAPKAFSENKILTEKEDATGRRGKVRYLTGKELGRDAPPISYESKYEADKYKFTYETKDGQTRAENGIFENMGTKEQTYVVKGSYKYFDTDGIEYIVNYTADDRGFRPVITVNNPNRRSTA